MASSKLIAAEKSHVYDELAYIAFNMAPVARTECVVMHKAGILLRYTGYKWIGGARSAL